MPELVLLDVLDDAHQAFGFRKPLEALLGRPQRAIQIVMSDQRAAVRLEGDGIGVAFRFLAGLRNLRLPEVVEESHLFRPTAATQHCKIPVGSVTAPLDRAHGPLRRVQSVGARNSVVIAPQVGYPRPGFYAARSGAASTKNSTQGLWAPGFPVEADAGSV